jgi:hypothetical protein
MTMTTYNPVKTTCPTIDALAITGRLTSDLYALFRAYGLDTDQEEAVRATLQSLTINRLDEPVSEPRFVIWDKDTTEVITIWLDRSTFDDQLEDLLSDNAYRLVDGNTVEDAWDDFVSFAERWADASESEYDLFDNWRDNYTNTIEEVVEPVPFAII